MLSIDPSKPRYRTLWISDVHLGMKASRAKCLADFLQHHDAETIYLLGDIVDGLRLRRKWHWTPDCDRVVRSILDKARGGTRVVYIPGNHDAFLRAYAGETVCGIEVALDAEHVTADGRLLHMQHGDAFDGLIRIAPALEIIGHGVYHLATFLGHCIHATRRRLGRPYWSLARFLKSRSKNARQYIETYEKALLSEARDRKVSGIISGHIHQPAIFEEQGIRYYNCGDWVDHCTLLAEHRDGHMELISWDESRLDAGAAPAHVSPGFAHLLGHIIEEREPAFG